MLFIINFIKVCFFSGWSFANDKFLFDGTDADRVLIASTSKETIQGIFKISQGNQPYLTIFQGNASAICFHVSALT